MLFLTALVVDVWVLDITYSIPMFLGFTCILIPIELLLEQAGLQFLINKLKGL